MTFARIVCLALLLGCCARARAEESIVSGHVDLIEPGGKPWTGGAGNTAVWLVPIGVSPPPAAEEARKQPARLVQKNKSFLPRVVLLRAGTAVEFPNHDPFFHNVFSLFDGKRFDLGLYEAGGTRFVRFDKPGVSFIFCNIHPEMSGVVIAVPTPYFALTEASGNVAIHDVPAGRYVLHVWNERGVPGASEAATKEVTISAGASSFGTLRLPVSVAPEAPHKNKYGRDYDPSAPSNPVYEQP